VLDELDVHIHRVSQIRLPLLERAELQHFARFRTRPRSGTGGLGHLVIIHKLSFWTKLGRKCAS
jgi:hypothetical protein